MINPEQYRYYIIRPTLKEIDLYSEEAEEILIMTQAQESHGGRYLHQLGKGPALGGYQMEPATYQDCEDWLKNSRPELWRKVQRLVIPMPSGSVKGKVAQVYREFYLQLFDPCVPELMIHNLKFATAMARCNYLRKPGALPAADDIQGMAEYYKKYWNTHLGAATIEETIRNYERYG